MKKNIVYFSIVALIFWSCNGNGKKERLSVISIAELSTQGILQRSDSGLDSVSVRSIKELWRLDLSLRSQINAMDRPYMLYDFGICCPCDSIAMNYGDICCPCPSISDAYSQRQLNLISITDWETKVSLISGNNEPIQLKAEPDGKFQLFSLKGVPNGTYELVLDGKFTKGPVSIKVNIKDGMMSYEL